jgi:integrase
LTTEAVDVLRKWRPYAPRELVIGVKTSLKKSFGAVLIAAKIDRFRWHDFRHCFASKLAQRSVSLNVIRDLLGHADLKMVMRYAHLAPDNFRAAIDALEARP